MEITIKRWLIKQNFVLGSNEWAFDWRYSPLTHYQMLLTVVTNVTKYSDTLAFCLSKNCVQRVDGLGHTICGVLHENDCLTLAELSENDLTDLGLEETHGKRT